MYKLFQMDVFATYKKLSIEEPILRLIISKSKSFGKYILHTYTVKSQKNKFEDDIYASNPVLVLILPRACSILTYEGSIVTALQGPDKFSGLNPIDEDPEEGEDEKKVNTLINIYDTILAWAADKELHGDQTEKENGKFAICQIIYHLGQHLILCGSKNYHILVTLEQIEQELHKHGEIMCSILTDIRAHYEDLILLSEWFSDGFSLAGELCDGLHFTDGDNKISWFGMFRDGQTMETVSCFNSLRKRGLRTVSFKTVFTPDNDVSELQNVILASRCKQSEGSVLRFRNIRTGKTILFKKKSAVYISKRFARGVILRGYKEIDKIRDRFIDAQEYHGLSTDASIRITKQLYSFAFWMMRQQYPCSVLNHQSGGFNTYWKKYISDSSDNTEIIVTPDDFGDFNKEEYLANTEPYKKRSYAKPVTVAFIQGLQGSGKSEIGKYCSGVIPNSTYIEQDMFSGDTLACQGALYHMIADWNGPDVIFITRCNMNPQQYSRYLDICHKLPTVVTFFSPNIVTPLYFMVCVAGIMNRSDLAKPNFLRVGKSELPINDVITFTQTNYKDYKQKTTENVYSICKIELGLDKYSKGAFLDNGTIIKFVNMYRDDLMLLRLPIKTVCEPIISKVTTLMSGIYNTKPYIMLPSRTIYVGAAVSVHDRTILESVLSVHNNEAVNMTKYLDHMTVHFVEKGKEKEIPADLILPGQKLTVMIDALIIRKSDGASAFRIVSEKEDSKKNLHITAQIPNGLPPALSNSFVGLTDDSVKVIPMTIPIKLVGFWRALD